MLERDGVLYGTSGLWSDPIEAVSGDPEAEERARKFVSRTRTGLLMGVFGLVGEGVGVAMITSESGHREWNIAWGAIAVGSVLTVVVGAIVAATSRHHLYDAINIYNDGAYRRSQAWLIPAPDSLPPGTEAAAGGLGRERQNREGAAGARPQSNSSEPQ